MLEHKIIDFRGFAPLPWVHKELAGRAGYAKRFKSFDAGGDVSVADRLALLDELGIERQVVSSAGAPLEDLASLVKETDRLVPIAEMSPTPCMQAVETVRKAHDCGLRLIGLTPYREGVPASDRVFYPAYAACCELRLGVIIHASTHFGRNQSMSLGHPDYLDQVAMDFPELTIIASHGGWPWVNEILHLGFRRQRTKYFAAAGSGWEMLMRHARGPLRSKIVWGSTAPFFDLADQVKELGDLDLPDGVKRAILSETPAAILARCGASV